VSVTKRHRKAGALAALGAATVAAVAAAASPPVAVKTTSRNEKAPAADGVFLAWAQSRATTASPFDVWTQRGDAPAWKVNAPNTQGYPGGIDGIRLAYQQIRGTAADIRVYDLVAKRHVRLPAGVNTRRRECCATLAGDFLLFTRGSPKARTPQLIVLANLRTGRSRVLDSLRSRRGVLTAGQVSESHAVWLKCNPHPQCRIVRHQLGGGTTVLPTGTNVYAPSVSDVGTIFYARRGPGCGQSVQIVRQPPVGPAEVLTSLPSGEDVSVTYTDSPVNTEVAPLPAWIYFDRFKCQGRRSDVFKVREGIIIHASGRR
jgi:hypothetical protein